MLSILVLSPLQPKIIDFPTMEELSHDLLTSKLVESRVQFPNLQAIFGVSRQNAAPVFQLKELEYCFITQKPGGDSIQPFQLTNDMNSLAKKRSNKKLILKLLWALKASGNVL